MVSVPLVQSSEARTPSTAKNTRTFHLTPFIGATAIGLRPETSVPNHMSRVQCSRSGHLHHERTNLHTIQPPLTRHTMPSLLAGYASSDDGEVEHAGPQLQQEEEDDDAQIAAQIQQDAFGLSASGPSRQRAASRSEAGSHILSAPDVLKEVSPRSRSLKLISGRIPMALEWPS